MFTSMPAATEAMSHHIAISRHSLNLIVRLNDKIAVTIFKSCIKSSNYN